MKLIVITLAGLLLASAGHAANINERQDNQHDRIAQGVASGELNRSEASRLRNEQRHVNRAERIAKSDGIFTRKERAYVQHEQDQASRHIYRLKHNE
jgi:hypothetical protein